MIKNLLYFTIITLSIACSNSVKNQMLVNGDVKELKKGTLFLQKIENGELSNLDSLTVDGSGIFEFTTSIESSQLYFLSLNKNSDNTIPFFGETGTITINTNLNKFVYGAKISGSKNQDILDKYNEMQSKFQNRNLEMIKEKFLAEKDQNQHKIDSLQASSKRLLRNKYLYTINFALTNKDSEVAPYLALTQLADANIKYLDTINKSLSDEIKNSNYGKELNSYIEKIKS
jgi:hypothetical protein